MKTRGFYIATEIHGKGIEYVYKFDSRLDFIVYASQVLVESNQSVHHNDSISTICHKLYDLGPGVGSRSHYRISRSDAIEHWANDGEGW